MYRNNRVVLCPGSAIQVSSHSRASSRDYWKGTQIHRKPALSFLKKGPIPRAAAIPSLISSSLAPAREWSRRAAGETRAAVEEAAAAGPSRRTIAGVLRRSFCGKRGNSVAYSAGKLRTVRAFDLVAAE